MFCTCHFRFSFYLIDISGKSRDQNFKVALCLISCTFETLVNVIYSFIYNKNITIEYQCFLRSSSSSG